MSLHKLWYNIQGNIHLVIKVLMCKVIKVVNTVYDKNSYYTTQAQAQDLVGPPLLGMGLQPK